MFLKCFYGKGRVIKGKTDPVAAFTVQKLKVDGDIGKALRLKDIIASNR